MILLLLSILLGLSNAESFKTRCFMSKTDHAVSNAHPIAELFRVSASDCMNYCINNAAKVGDGCASLVYHREFSTCQLYGHDGEFEGSVIVPVNGHDFYRRSSFIGSCQDPVVPKRGYKQMPEAYGVAVRPATPPSAYGAERLIPGPSVTEVTTTTTEIAKSEDDVLDPRVNVILPPEFGEQEEPEKPIDENARRIAFLNPTQNNVCPSKETVGYFVIFGYRLEASNPSKLVGIDQSSCIMYCSQNINKIGEKVPCFSINYDPVNEKCHLYDNQSREKGLAVLAEDKEFIFADKFCLKTHRDCSAESPFIVYPQKQMHRKIITSFPGMNSVVPCIAACIDYEGCKAVTYKVGLCILHGATPASDSSLLVDGNEETLVVENGCQLSAKSIPAMISESIGSLQDNGKSPWEEWSDCSFGINGKKVRVRQRECEECEDLQTKEC